MCEHDSSDDILRGNELSRRHFGALGLGAGLAAMLPRIAGAAEASQSEVEIRTPDGTCDAHFAWPAGGPTAAVLVWPDVFGLRPAFRAMGTRLAEAGYAVLTVNPFYRIKKGEPASREDAFAAMRTLTPTTHVTDARAFVAWLDAQRQVDTRRKIGTTGYCMGGPMVMRTAAAVPSRVGAGGSFHGGGLATNADNSPHLLIPQMEASFLIAIAENDDANEPEAKETLREHFAANGLDAEIEVYAGAQHGWCVPDSAVYHEEQAERAWSRMLALFDKALA